MTRMLREFDRPEIDVEGTDYGLRLFTLRQISEKHTHVRVTNLVFPYAFVIPMSAEMTITQWHVPVDDTSCYWYAIFTSFGAPVDTQQMREQRLQLYELPDYRPRIGRHNNYGYDVAEQKTQTFTGMGFDINVHDQWAIESQGRIQDRTREHLGYHRQGDRRLPPPAALGDRPGGQRREAADVARPGARRRHPRPGHRRRHGPDRGLGGLLEGRRRAPPQRFELGRQHRARRSWRSAHASSSNEPACGRTTAGRRRARPSGASRRARCRSCAWPSPTSTACCAARRWPRARSPRR